MRDRESYLAEFRFLKSEILLRMVEVDALEYHGDAVQAAIEVLGERGIEARPPAPETHQRKLDRAKEGLASGHSRGKTGLILIVLGILFSLGSGGRWFFYGLVTSGLFLISSGLSRKGTAERLQAELDRLGAQPQGTERASRSSVQSPEAVGPHRITFELDVPESATPVPKGLTASPSLDKPKVECLRDPDQIVVSCRGVVLVVEYPLTVPAELPLTADSEEGFSRKALVLAISRAYREIYEEEERTAGTKTIPVDQRVGILNRNRTDGKYGIWGHDLADLVLRSVTVRQQSDGSTQLRLAVDS